MRRIITLALALVCWTTAANAQSPQSFQWTASVVVAPFLSCAVTKNIEYGTHFRTAGVLSTDLSNFAQLNCQSDPGNIVDVSFTLPSVLTKAGGGSVPISYGANSAKFSDGTLLPFNPAAGLSGHTISSSDGSFALLLGFTGIVGNDEAVTINVGSAPSGSYSGTITTTIAVR